MGGSWGGMCLRACGVPSLGLHNASSPSGSWNRPGRWLASPVSPSCPALSLSFLGECGPCQEAASGFLAVSGDRMPAPGHPVLGQSVLPIVQQGN